MLRRIYGFVLIAAWLAHAMADDGFTANNYFIEPQPNGPANDFTENKAYIIGDSVQIRWETNFTKMSVTIWQNNNPEFHYIQDMSMLDKTVKSFNWTVDDEGFDLGKGKVFFFDVWDESGTGKQLTSHYFYITRRSSSDTSAQSSAISSSAISSTTSSASSSIASSTASVSSQNSLTAASPTSSPPGSSLAPSLATQTPDNSHTGLSTGVKIGIGVGISVGAIGIATLLLGIYLLRRARASKARNDALAAQRDQYYTNYPSGSDVHYAGYGQNNPLGGAHQYQTSPQSMSANGNWKAESTFERFEVPSENVDPYELAATPRRQE